MSSTARPTYELLYHPGIPGRGEYIRLPLEAAKPSGAKYIDVANQEDGGYDKVQALMKDDIQPPNFAPPMLRVAGAGKNGKDLVIHQTPNILQYLGPRIGMIPANEADAWHVNQLALTALDLSNEAHDTHHPVAVMKYYEEQKDEALKKAQDFRENRIPKFFTYFERTLNGNKAEGKGQYLVGEKLTYADTTLWQVVDGLLFAFPKELEARKADFPLIFETFYPKFKEEAGIRDYLHSDRRLKYSMGIFRYYKELDRQ